MSCTETGRQDRATLLELARLSVASGIDFGRSLEIEVCRYSERLQQPRASFVTLYRDSELAGCIGTLEASRPTVLDVVENAYAAGFSDRRFSRFEKPDLDRMNVEIALLSELFPVSVNSQEELIQELDPGRHGLLVEMGAHRATFLPKVWRSISSRRRFVEQLKLKAGMHADFWSKDIKCYLYTAESFSDV